MIRTMEGIDGVAGSALAHHTGTWRRGQYPVFAAQNCTDCRLCVMFCPDAAIERVQKGVYRVNLNYCKGCGICAEECPAKDIRMEEGQPP